MAVEPHCVRLEIMEMYVVYHFIRWCLPMAPKSLLSLLTSKSGGAKMGEKQEWAVWARSTTWLSGQLNSNEPIATIHCNTDILRVCTSLSFYSRMVRDYHASFHSAIQLLAHHKYFDTSHYAGLCYYYTAAVFNLGAHVTCHHLLIMQILRRYMMHGLCVRAIIRHAPPRDRYACYVVVQRRTAFLCYCQPHVALTSPRNGVQKIICRLWTTPDRLIILRVSKLFLWCVRIYHNRRMLAERQSLLWAMLSVLRSEPSWHTTDSPSELQGVVRVLLLW